MSLTELSITQFANQEASLNRITRLDHEHILDSTSLSSLRTLRNIIYLQPIATSTTRKEHHRVVHSARIDMLDEIIIARSTTLRANTATSLSAELS